jgi:FkbM family methyltransferase
MSARIDAEDFKSFARSHTSYAESHQDLFALYLLGNKKEGYFVDFGAGDGVTGSNSYLLEKNYQWSGIVCEPCRSRHAVLQANRQCSIDLRCVYTSTGKQVEFLEAQDNNLSTISAYVSSDKWKEKRLESPKSYQVETVSLGDLLSSHNAPQKIDYLSLDTEGSEFHILCNYDFSREISIITVEHNNNAYRSGIFGLLTQRGYERVLEGYCAWDDWYALKTILAR